MRQVTINYSGRLGNNMFQYAFGRIISETLSAKFVTLPDKFQHQEHFPNIKDGHKGDRLNNDIVFDETTNFQLTPMDIYLSPVTANLFLTGYWQRWKFYRAHEYEIKLWFHLPEFEAEIHPSDIILHFRRDDYIEAKSELPFSYYKNILRSRQYNQLYITGDIDVDVRDAFDCYSPTYVSLSPIDTIRFMKKFDNIVIANSSFSWWGAFLSRAQNIWCPLPKSGYWSPSQTQDLFIPDRMIQVKL